MKTLAFLAKLIMYFTFLRCGFVEVPIFKGKGDVISCGLYRVVKPLEHDTKNIY